MKVCHRKIPHDGLKDTLEGQRLKSRRKLTRKLKSKIDAWLLKKNDRI